MCQPSIPVRWVLAFSLKFFRYIGHKGAAGLWRALKALYCFGSWINPTVTFRQMYTESLIGTPFLVKMQSNYITIEWPYHAYRARTCLGVSSWHLGSAGPHHTTAPTTSLCPSAISCGQPQNHTMQTMQNRETGLQWLIPSMAIT